MRSFAAFAGLMIACGLVGPEVARATEGEAPEIDVSKLLGEVARSKSIAVTVSAWEQKGRPDSERYFVTTSSQLGTMFTDLASLQKSMYMRRASIRTVFAKDADPFKSGADFSDAILTVDCRTMSYQFGDTKLRRKNGEVVMDLGGLSDPAESKREGPWYEASMLLCSS